jgi:plastocyanin
MNMMCPLSKVMMLGASLAVLSGTFSSQAATANVLVGSGGNFFVPAKTNIAVNDRVLWTWAGGTHNVTSTNGAWTSSGNKSSGTFTNTFTTAGTYFYFCSLHGNATSGMTGAVIVAAANLPPTVTLTNPASGTVLAAPANVTLGAAAADGDGTVTNVQFLVDANVVGNDTTAPYAAVTNNLAAGSHTLAAVASDNSGAKSTNSTTLSVVTPVAVLLSAPQSLPAAKFRFTYTADAGLSYLVQRSTNLLSTNWTALATNQAGGSSINFTDANATFSRGFYRVGRLPNP